MILHNPLATNTNINPANGKIRMMYLSLASYNCVAKNRTPASSTCQERVPVIKEWQRSQYSSIIFKVIYYENSVDINVYYCMY